MPDNFESELVAHIENMQKLFFGLNADKLRELAFELAKANNIKVPFNATKKRAGKDWFKRFLLRHPNISIRQP